MILDLVHCGGLEFRYRSGGGGIRAFISASYIVVALFFIFHDFPDQGTILQKIGITVLVIGGLVAWLSALTRYRVIADTPTALLRSAAQGYVELNGTCRPVPDSDLLHYGRAPPCLWYRAKITEHKSGFGKSGTTTRIERSDDCFLVEDGTGECVIDPEHAEVQSAHKTSWRDGSRRYSVDFLVEGDRLYAIGSLHTLRAADGTLDRKTDVSALLRLWKTDRAALLKRFDSDGDGDIDLKEWQRAVSAAEREVDAQHRQMRLEPGVHMLRAPDDGRPFLLSNRDPDELRQRYKWWAWFHLGVFVAAAVWGMSLLLTKAQ